LNSAKIARLNLRHERMFAILPFRSEGQWSAQQAFIFDWRRNVPTFDLDDRSWMTSLNSADPGRNRTETANIAAISATVRRPFDSCGASGLAAAKSRAR
jgi:hypothetical protein